MGRGSYHGGSTIIRPGSNWFGGRKKGRSEMPASEADLAAGASLCAVFKRERAAERAEKLDRYLSKGHECNSVLSEKAKPTVTAASRHSDYSITGEQELVCTKSKPVEPITAASHRVRRCYAEYRQWADQRRR